MKSGFSPYIFNRVSNCVIFHFSVIRLEISLREPNYWQDRYQIPTAIGTSVLPIIRYLVITILGPQASGAKIVITKYLQLIRLSCQLFGVSQLFLKSYHTETLYKMFKVSLALIDSCFLTICKKKPRHFLCFNYYVS